MSFGGGPKTVQSTTSTGPPAWLQPFLTSAAQTYLNQVSPGNQLAQPGTAGGPKDAPGAFPVAQWNPAMGQQIAPLTQAQQTGLANVYGASLPSAQLAATGAGQLQSTMQGAYQGVNPTDPYLANQMQASQLYANPANAQLGRIDTSAQINPANPQLQSIMQTSPMANPANPFLGGTMQQDYLTANPTNAYLGQMMGTDPNANPSNQYFGGAMQGQYLNANPANPYLTGTMGGAFMGGSSATPYLNAATSGAFLGSNPYMDAAYGAAASNVVNQYRNAIAPSTDVTAMQAGVGGGTAARQGQALNQFGLGQNLSNLAATMYGQEYTTERGLQQQAAQTAQQAFEAERANQQQAAQLYGQQYAQERAQQQAAAGQYGQNFQQMLQNQLAAAGQYGGQYQQAAQNQLQAAGLMGQNYQQGIANQLAATGQLGANYQQGLATQLAGAGQLGQNYQQALNAQLAASGQLGQQYEAERQRQLQATQLLPTGQQALMQPGMAQLGAGTFQQGQTQAQLDANTRNAIAQQQYPYTILSGLMNAFSQAGGGTGTTVSVGPNPSASKGLF